MQIVGFVLLAPYVCFHIFSSVKVTEWPPIGKIAAHSAYEMFSWYHYLIVGLVFSHLGFWSGNLFLIAPFPDLCLLVPFHMWQLIFESDCYLSLQMCKILAEIVMGLRVRQGNVRQVFRLFKSHGRLCWG